MSMGQSTVNIPVPPANPVLDPSAAQAFSALYDRYAPAVLGIIIQTLDNEKQAGEILERSFVKLWKEMQVQPLGRDRIFMRLTAIAREYCGQAQNIDAGNLKALELVYFKGYSATAAAEQLNINPDELKSRLRAELNLYRSMKK